MSRKKPIMGWSSWNHFRINISEDIIREQADAMVESGLKKAGYAYINIDDGYFGGRDEDGKLLSHSEKFPSGMKSLADYIHSKDLKAGIYSEAGCNTCGLIYDKDQFGKGVGLYGHDRDDISLFFREWGYDFLKVDWCGGLRQKLNEKERYTEISRIIRELAPEAVFNVCRWKFPGEWVTEVADSWRISADIEPVFAPALRPGSILNIVEKNAGLHPYCGPGHYNDMDMLQVGRGMTLPEDRSHFSLWCMMSSPLLAGNDLRNMSTQTIEVLTQPDLIGINQDELGRQAVRVQKRFGLQIWYKPLSGNRSALAVLNTRHRKRRVRLDLKRWFSSGELRECWTGRSYSNRGGGAAIELEAHGIAVFLGKNN